MNRNEGGLVRLQRFFDAIAAAGVVVDRDAVRRHVEEIAPMIRDTNRLLRIF